MQVIWVREAQYANLYLRILDDLLASQDTYAWTVVKSSYLHERLNGSTHLQAKDTALQKLREIYEVRLNSLTNRSMITAQVACLTYNKLHESYFECIQLDNCNAGSLPYVEACEAAGDCTTSRNSAYSCQICIRQHYEEFEGNDTYYYAPCLKGSSSVFNTWWMTIQPDGSGIYHEDWWRDRISAIVSKYNNIKSNAQAYLDALAEMEVNATTVQELLDPITLATQFSTDWNTTGYYRFVAAEAALTGIPVALNSTVCFEIQNETYCGVMFTNWDNETFTLTNYTVPSGKFVWLITEDNELLRLAGGDSFRIVNITDAQGNPVNYTVVYRYVEHSGNASAIIEELQKLNALWEEYMNMQTTIAGSSGLGSWWASLSDTEKIAIIAAGAVIIILLARK